MAVEAKTMNYLRTHGYPIPAVAEVSADGTELVMERIKGASLLAELSQRPWTLYQHGKVLADLHRRLHEIPAPPWLTAAPGSPGNKVVHLDLHPLNVIMSPDGPVVIDWTNAAQRVGATDVALTWVLLATAGIPTGRLKASFLGRFRTMFVNAFLSQFVAEDVHRELAAVVEWKIRDTNMTTSEKDAMQSLLNTSEPHL